MRAAGIREIKNRLSEYLRYVASGETVLVTHHGRAKGCASRSGTTNDIRSDSRFARCRALDAFHACTALLMREWTGHAVRIETFDDRLKELARELNLA